MTKTLVHALFSVVIPAAAYAFFFLAGLFPARLPEPGVYLSLSASHAVGLFLAVIALSRSNVKPMNISPGMRLAVLLGSMGIFINIVALELVLTATVLPLPPTPPES